MYSQSQLVEVLRDTIRRLEQSIDVSPDDPALLELKRIILLKIASIELEEDRESGTQAPGIQSRAPTDSTSST